MEWLRNEIEKRHREGEEISLIIRYADAVFATVWRAILEVVNDIDAAEFGLIPNGCEGHREVKMREKRLEVVLYDKRFIHAVCSPDIDFRFELKVKRDDSQNIVYVDWKGKEVKPAEIAEMVMKPFLFGTQN